jgi:hypothetical protein
MSARSRARWGRRARTRGELGKNSKDGDGRILARTNGVQLFVRRGHRRANGLAFLRAFAKIISDHDDGFFYM